MQSFTDKNRHTQNTIDPVIDCVRTKNSHNFEKNQC